MKNKKSSLNKQIKMQSIKNQSYYPEVDAFWSYIKGLITVREWENMPNYLGITERQWGFMTSSKFNLVEKMSAEHLGLIAKLINETPQELIFRWGVGKKAITLEEANALVRPQGYEWGVQTHVA